MGCEHDTLNKRGAWTQVGRKLRPPRMDPGGFAILNAPASVGARYSFRSSSGRCTQQMARGIDFDLWDRQ
jgi:hypothetical protein